MLNRVISTNTTAIVTSCSSRAWRFDWKHDARGRFGPWNHCVLKLCQFTQTERRCNWLHDKSLWIQWHQHTAVMKKKGWNTTKVLCLVWKLENHQSCLKFLLVVASFCLNSNCWSALHILPDSRAYILHTFLLFSPFCLLVFDRKSIFILKALCLSVVQCIRTPLLKSLWSVLLNHLTLKRTSKWNLRSSDCPVQRKKAKKLKGSGKITWEKTFAANEKNHSPSSPFYCIPQHLLFSTRAVIDANVRRGECRENNYPLPQPAGLFINMQLWFHGSPLYTSHSRAETSAKAPSMKTS